MIGQELGGRYEVIERIGGGGMALVYKGHDILLHRKVAIKVLRQQYVHDEEFIRRFRREAQSAASLSHSNVVSIYDVGQEDEIHYIVMEYIEGKTLNDLIKERAPLPVEEAVHIASQICDALDHAHQNQIIHRDIKPHNILIGKNGRVKVTDFGIARAADSSQLTQTGSVVGSVHYFSPEHAKGVQTGAKSDIYSLGIVMYQMLTGRLPFLGESPISVALKHLQETFEDPRKVNPLIPQSIENIIVKSMRKNPEERYQSAKQMLYDLESCLLPDRRNETKLYFADADDQENTRVIPAIRPDRYSQEPRQMANGNGRAAEKSGKRRSWLKPTIWILMTIILLLAMWYGVKAVQNMFNIEEVDIPNVVNMNVIEAEALLKEKKLLATVIPRANPDVAKDIVIEQKPAGMKVNIHSTITLYVSSGAEKQVMPNFTGKLIKDVKLELSGLGLKESQIVEEQVFIDEPAGQVIQQIPQVGEEYDPKTAIFKFTVSKGRETFEMPDLIGRSEAEAKSRITLNGLVLPPENIIRQPSYKQGKGIVFDQWPFDPKEPVTKGETVKIYVSTGLPEDAVEHKASISVSPFKDGQSSKIKIVVSDARSDNVDYLTKTITKVEVIDVRVVVAKDKNAVIQVYRDDTLVNSRTITYKDVSTDTTGTKNQGSNQTGGRN